MTVRLESSWQTALQREFTAPYWQELTNVIRHAYQEKTVYPPPQQIFAALNLCPLPTVKAVILGQDPYHGPGQAHGLAFSVQPGTPLPPSLQNIYKELSTDLGITTPTHGDLTAWAKQGVLLLNTTLTVKASAPLSHRNLGWEQFTDAIINVLGQQHRPLVFLLWGKHAQSKQLHIDTDHHLVLTAPHPSPLSAHRGFFGCQHFSKCNTFLERTKQGSIAWNSICD